MYSALLLEDFWSGLKNSIQSSNPVSTFIVGMLAGLYVPKKSHSKLEKLKNGVIIGGKLISQRLLLELFDKHLRKFRTIFSPIIAKFTTPIAKVVKSLENNTFVTPHSKFFDIIQYAITFLFLFLGFTTTKVILLLLGKEKKENLFEQYKKFITTIVIALFLSLIMGLINSFDKSKLHKLDIDEFKRSPYKLRRAVAKAYELVASRYPQITKVPLYYEISSFDDEYAIKYNGKNVLGVPAEYPTHVTEEEYVAVYLHEFGHLLNIRSLSTVHFATVTFITLWMRSFTKLTWASALMEFAGEIIDQFLASVTSFNQEIAADTFAASFGYGPQLISALRKISRSYEFTEADWKETLKSKLLSHPARKERFAKIKYAIVNYYKEQTDALLGKAYDAAADINEATDND
jgi:Zn-dependent protease with chaperone function